MSENPIARFAAWYAEPGRAAAVKHPAAVCLATVSRSGQPEARMVELKRFDERGFVFTTSFGSPKGVALLHNPAAALTFWWDSLGRQIRITGTAEKLPHEESRALFRARPRDAQIATLASHQSQILSGTETLAARVREIQAGFEAKEIPCPENWGGFGVRPSSIEFFTFRPERLHERVLFTREGDLWNVVTLEP